MVEEEIQTGTNLKVELVLQEGESSEPVSLKAFAKPDVVGLARALHALAIYF
jgi:hypothetical protein